MLVEDRIEDDAAALLARGLGDEGILRQILRAYGNGEVISNFERNYVEKLVEEHFGPRPRLRPPEGPPPALQSAPSVGAPVVHPAMQVLGSRPRPVWRRRGVLLAVLAAVAVAASVAAASLAPGGDPPPPPPPLVPLSVSTDLASYAAGDIISISGRSTTIGTASISVEGPSSGTVWSEEVRLRGDGTYSTLLIAGGAGWDEAGTYTVVADNRQVRETAEFSFSP